VNEKTERANAYKQMMEMWAWKDFAKALDQIESTAVMDFLSWDDSGPVEFKSGQVKGTISCIRKIKRILDQIINEV
jgi:hypothetical protein